MIRRGTAAGTKTGCPSRSPGLTSTPDSAASSFPNHAEFWEAAQGLEAGRKRLTQIP